MLQQPNTANERSGEDSLKRDASQIANPFMPVEKKHKNMSEPGVVVRGKGRLFKPPVFRLPPASDHACSRELNKFWEEAPR